MAEPLKPVDALIGAMRSGPKRIEYVDLAYAFIEEAGGTRNMARLMWEEWKSAKAGSISRQRLMAAVLEVLKKGDEKARSQGEVSKMSDADLEKAMREVMQKMGLVDGETKKDTTDAAGSPAPA